MWSRSRDAMKRIRDIHLYLGCVFAPFVMLFAFTGALQEFGLRGGDRTILTRLAAVHSLQRFGTDQPASLPLMILAALMGLSLIVTSALGVVMALRLGTNRKTVWSCLGFGFFLPAVLLLVEAFKK